ncbi:hypothetical protein FM125_05245 [Micrococcus lylae]|uniref:Uncharacterized protein n=1 Tax=Micrococcus lylae TaxID=1273 RepID=A0A1R4IY96_9MICC|nr:hypothetical protein FM125_05245 [Micrococcus lylae]
MAVLLGHGLLWAGRGGGFGAARAPAGPGLKRSGWSLRWTAGATGCGSGAPCAGGD